MAFFLYLVFLAFFTTGTGILAYYADLLFFRRKKNYSREEITEPWLRAYERIANALSPDIPMGGILFGIGALFSFVWSLASAIFGGGFGEANAPSHFFHFPLPYFAAFFSFPFLKEVYSEKLPLLFRFERALVSGLGLGSLSSAFAGWGHLHEMHFLFCSVVFLSVIPPLLWLWNGKPFLGSLLGPPVVWENLGEASREEVEDFSEEEVEFPSEAPSPWEDSSLPEEAIDSQSDFGDLDFDDFEPKEKSS